MLGAGLGYNGGGVPGRTGNHRVGFLYGLGLQAEHGGIRLRLDAFAERDSHGAAVLIPVGGPFAHGLQDDAAQGFGHIEIQFLRRRGVGLDHVMHHGAQRLTRERLLAREQFVQHHGHGKQVGTPVDLLAHELLGAHVERRADERPLLRQCRIGHVSDAEVGQLDRRIPGHHDIGRLDIAVDHAVVMGASQGLADVRADCGSGFRREIAPVLDQVPQVAALEEFHCDIGDAFFLARVVDRNDIGMVQGARGARLAQEPFHHFACVRGRFEHVAPGRLDRDAAPDIRV